MATDQLKTLLIADLIFQFHFLHFSCTYNCQLDPRYVAFLWLVIFLLPVGLCLARSSIIERKCPLLSPSDFLCCLFPIFEPLFRCQYCITWGGETEVPAGFTLGVFQPLMCVVPDFGCGCLGSSALDWEISMRKQEAKSVILTLKW